MSIAGNIADLAIAKQTAQGAAAASSTYRHYLTGGGLAPRRVENDLEETSSGRLRNDSFLSLVSAEGAPEFAARLEFLPLYLEGVMGALATTGAGDPYSHEVTLANDTPWFTLWRMLGDLVFEKFVDCKIGQLVITSEAGMPLKIAANILGLDPHAKTTHEVTAGIVLSTPLMHYDGAGAFLVEGAAVTSIERMVMTINNNDQILQGDSHKGDDVAPGMRAITIEAVHRIIDAALYNRWHYGSATPADEDAATKETTQLTAGIDFKWTRVAAAPGPERSLQIVAPRLKVTDITGYEPNTSGDPLKETHTYKVYQPTAGEPLTATVINGEDGTDY